jgi:hypothetical protein
MGAQNCRVCARSTAWCECSKAVRASQGQPTQGPSENFLLKELKRSKTEKRGKR